MPCVSSTTTLAILTGTQLGAPIDANRELIATGAASLGGAFLGAMPAGGGTSQTALVRGARHRLLGRSDPADRIPLAIRKVRNMEFVWAIVAAFGVLTLGTLKGIIVAIILSLIGLSRQTANPRVSVIGRKRGADVLRPLSPEHPDDETFEGLLIVRPEGHLYFVNAQNVAEQIDALVKQYKPRVIALDMSRVSDIEYSALRALMEAEKRATDRGATAWLVGLNPGVLEVVRNSGLAERLGRERMLFNARAAIERCQALQATAGATARP